MSLNGCPAGPCKLGRSSALCEHNQAVWWQLPTSPSCTWECTNHFQGCSVRGMLFIICIYASIDHCCFSSGVQRSCVSGSEERVCRYCLQLQTVSSQCVGRDQADVSGCLLRLLLCWQVLVFQKCPPVAEFSDGCCWHLCLLLLVFKASCSLTYAQITVKQK